MKEKYKIIQERRVSVTNSFCYGAFYLLEIGGICLMSMKQMTIKEIKMLFAQETVTSDMVEGFRADKRAAVGPIVRRWEWEQADRRRVDDLYKYEYVYKEKGMQFIAGIDEAGRGPLAGPVVVAAVILPLGLYLPKINDSKKISAKVREELYTEIMAKAIAVGHAVVSEKVIDRINIYQATINGMYDAIFSLEPQPDQVLIDAVPLEKLPMPALSIIRGDSKSATIAAASIIAKVERDHLMDAYDKEYPEYGFSQHKGYGTEQHIAALKKYGPCPIHRCSFEPIKSLIQH